ncbi:ATP-binding protein [Hymenobacter psychrophilus]|uniref:histidine kinase n=1 Tax=Hymenobacter psychrophilus TaxID=651662 RepID=A0A1H3F0D7_9BACT|nr:ATP-binding protein [Hymenobacter psychrophilus]SDX84277.1 His Kinase A (phospho-acceptor) domain-containing protein [Hymenobacter psychrophilus]
MIRGHPSPLSGLAGSLGSLIRRIGRLLLLLQLLVLGLGVEQQGYAQNRRADSLRQLLRTRPHPDTLRVQRLHGLVQELAASNAPQAMRLSHQALRLSRRLADSASIGRSLLWLSILQRRLPNYDSARYYTLLAQQLYASRHDRRREARACLELSLIAAQQTNLTAALNWGLRGLRLAEQTSDQAVQTQLRAIIGDTYGKLGDYTSALPILNQALYNGHLLGDQQVVAAVLNSLGSVYQLQRNWPEALRYFRRAAAVSRRMGDMQNQLANEIGLAEVYIEQGQPARALLHGRLARTLVRSTQDDFNQPSVELLLARAFLLLHQPDSTLLLASHARQLSQQTRSNGNLSAATELLAQAYAELNNYPAAYQQQRLFAAYQDTVAGEATQRKTSDLRYGYELDKKETQIALLTKTRQLQTQKSARQRLQLYALLAGFAGLILMVGLMGRNVHLKQRINRHLNAQNAQVARQRDDLTRALADLTQALDRLKSTQNQLIQREKMASLGELTAGIAHEIQNPLNFVNNFSEVSTELVEEFMDGPWQQLPEAEKAYATELLTTLTDNLQKITQHGHRADSIVKGMLQHSQTSAGVYETINLNTLVTDHLALAYQLFQAKNPSFKATLLTDLSPQLPAVRLVPQDVGRVLLNLYANAFYALAQRSAQGLPGSLLKLEVHTSLLAQQVQVRILDNGIGMSEETRQKALLPFFTTKPPGEGTGLGLSLSYDIIVQGHGGTLSISSQPGGGTEVTMRLPR